MSTKPAHNHHEKTVPGDSSHTAKNPNCRLFVGGFQASLSNYDLFQHFSKFGEILNAQIMYDKKTGKSRSFGFIECGSIMVAEKILSMKHAIKGRDIDVNHAFKKDSKETSANWKKILFRKKLFVTNLPGFVSSKDLELYFRKFGSLRKAYIITEPLSKKPKGFGYVEFFDIETLNKVLISKNHEIKGHKIMCFRYKPKEQQKPTKNGTLNHQEEEAQAGRKESSGDSETQPTTGDSSSFDNSESHSANKDSQDNYAFKNEEEREDFSLQQQTVEYWQRKQLGPQEQNYLGFNNDSRWPQNYNNYPPQNPAFNQDFGNYPSFNLYNNSSQNNTAFNGRGNMYNNYNNFQTPYNNCYNGEQCQQGAFNNGFGVGRNSFYQPGTHNQHFQHQEAYNCAPGFQNFSEYPQKSFNYGYMNIQADDYSEKKGDRLQNFTAQRTNQGRESERKGDVGCLKSKNDKEKDLETSCLRYLGIDDELHKDDEPVSKGY